MLLQVLFKGVAIGLMVSIPMGPIGLICMQRTLNRGVKSGIFSGLGAATADTIFAIIAALGVGFIINFIEEKHHQLEFFSAIIILFLGLKIFYTNPVKEIRKKRTGKNKLTSDFFSVLFLTLTNPLTILVFFAIFAGINFSHESDNYIGQTLILTGIFGGAALWWFSLTFIVNAFRKKLHLRRLFIVNKVSGSIIFTLGILLLAGICFSFI